MSSSKDQDARMEKTITIVKEAFQKQGLTLEDEMIKNALSEIDAAQPMGDCGVLCKGCTLYFKL